MYRRCLDNSNPRHSFMRVKWQYFYDSRFDVEFPMFRTRNGKELCFTKRKLNRKTNEKENIILLLTCYNTSIFNLRQLGNGVMISLCKHGNNQVTTSDREETEIREAIWCQSGYINRK